MQDLNFTHGPEHSIQPLLNPNVPIDPSNIDQVVPSELWTVDQFFTEEECQAIIPHTENLGYAEAPVSTYNGPAMVKDLRDNERVMIQDQPAADLLFERVKTCAPRTFMGWVLVGINERLRFFKNSPGHYFGEHYDGCFPRNKLERSFMSLLVNVTADYEGGDTAFYDSRLPGRRWDNKAVLGRALIFNHHGWSHEGLRVMGGYKYMLRSDIMYRKVKQDSLGPYIGQECALCGEQTRISNDVCPKQHNVLICGCHARVSQSYRLRCPYC